MLSSSIKIVLWLVASTSVSHFEPFMLYSLAVVHGTPYMPSLISLLNSAGALFVLMYAANISCLLSLHVNTFLWNVCCMLNFDISI